MDDWRTKVYVCESADGGVSLIVPAKDYYGSEEDWLSLNELDAMERYLTLYPIQIPGDRYFRDAWELGDERIKINLDKAKSVHLSHLRRKRDKRLKELDIEALRAYEQGSEEKLESVMRLKEDLRNMPEDKCFNVDNVEDLRIAIPECLR